MAKYPGFFVNVMMNEELELQVPDPDDSPWKSGFVTFSAFVVFGVVPLLGHITLHTFLQDTDRMRNSIRRGWRRVESTFHRS